MKTTFNTLTAWALCLATLCPAANEIGFVESFALAEDRTQALEQLIPGTDEYYYFHGLHYQNTGQRKPYDAVMKLWKARNKHAHGIRMLENRQALIDYPKNPEASLEHIRKALNVKYNYSRRSKPVKGLHPSKLDNERISADALLDRALNATNQRGTSGIEEDGLILLQDKKLGPELRRDLLNRLQRPDFPGLVDLIDADLRFKDSRGFGSMNIHRLLLIDQLDQLAKKMPDLMKQQQFVHLYLSKLMPNSDVDPQHDRAEMQAYLDRLNQAVAPLDPVFNSLKAHVLYHTLAFERAQGTYDVDRFMAYLKLPRNTSWTNPDYLKRVDLRNVHCQLNTGFNSVTLFPPIRDDAQLLRDFLDRFLVKAADYKAYAPYLRDTWLKQAFAETKILNGVGQVERWASMLTPAQYAAVKKRVDIQFSPTNPERFGLNAPVSLKVQLKNTKELLVKVFEINAYNYYRDTKQEIDTAISLDGLVATVERREDLSHLAPERRIEKTFAFPELKQPGVYVVELIGNGVSSRALVFKGRLNTLHQVTPDGHAFMVLDAHNRQIKDATLWMGGKEYAAEKSGIIALPFSTKAQRETIILRKGKQASLDTFYHGAENYQFHAGFYIDREALLRHREATLLVRPQLLLSGTKVSVKELEDVRLVYETTNIFGIKSRQEIKDFKLSDGREALHTLRVPEGLTRITFELHARIRNLSRNKHEDLKVSRSFQLNGIDKTQHVDAVLSSRDGAAHTLELRGRNGEAKPLQVLNVELKHRLFGNTIHVQLQTDEDGRCDLGELKDIAWYKVRGPSVITQQFSPDRDQVILPTELHGADDQALSFAVNPDTAHALLLDEAGGHFRRDFTDRVKIKKGRLTIAPLPVGDYTLFVESKRIPVRIAQGDLHHGRVFSATRALQIRSAEATSISGLILKKTGLEIQLQGTNRTTRVHVIAARYAPEYDLYQSLKRGPGRLAMRTLTQPDTLYVAGRNIGDEYRYILDRSTHPKYPGNMAERPGLLLNPWAIRKTDQGEEQLARGGEYDKKQNPPAPKRPMRAKPSARMLKRESDSSVVAHYSNLDFLADGSLLAANLVANKEGVVNVPIELLKGKTQVRILVLSADQALLRNVSLPTSGLFVRDLRLRKAFDPAVPLSEQKLVSILKKGQPFTIEDISASEMEVFDSIAGVYQLLSTLNHPEHFAEFGFLREWDQLKDSEKQENYSKYACHELNLFIQQKDPKFFKAVVMPYLENKKDATFMDQWLTGANLEAWQQPWAFGRLNPVERILLGQRVAAEQPAIKRNIRELYEIKPVDEVRQGRGFDTALATGFARYWGFAGEKSEGKSVRGSDLGDELISNVRLKTVEERKHDARLFAGVDAKRDMNANGAIVYLTDGRESSWEAEVEELMEQEIEFEDAELMDDAFGVVDFISEGEPARRGRLTSRRSLYRKMPVTQEWVENNYYRLPIEQQLSTLIPANRFWVDYAAHPVGTPFLSTHFTDATHNLTEMLMVLAVLDLPFKAGEHKVERKEARYTITPAHDVIAFHKEIRPAKKAAQPGSLLVSQHFFRADDRWRTEGAEKYEKYVKDEFLQHVVYGGKVILTNPSGNVQNLNLLLQIPEGALPVGGGFVAKGVPVKVDPHSTKSVEYLFYFPAPGTFAHYPVHVAKADEIVGQAKPFTFKVVEELSKVDKESWPWISQDGTAQQVLDYLEAHNIEETALDEIAWRMKDQVFFKKIIRLLDKRQKYSHALYSFALMHNDPAATRAWLQYSPFADQCGYWIDTELLTVDPVARHFYQHLEYAPLVNPRTHPVGKEATILNHRLLAQHQLMLGVLSNKPALDDTDRLVVTYYLALQDRVEEALAWFAGADREKIASQLQYDYMNAYLGMYEGKIGQASKIANTYKAHPVPRWRNKFLNILAQIAESGAVVDADDREQVQEQLASKEPALELKLEAGVIGFDYQNITSCGLNFYPMDIELLFSRNPFVQSQSRTFSYIEPVLSRTVQLPADQNRFTYEVPQQFRGKNVMVEAVSGGLRKARAYYANNLNVRLLETYGQVQVSQSDTKAPLSTVYVKVYARMNDGSVKFFKDGYTDFRGRFDYVSLNTNDLDQVQRFSLLLMSETHGAMIKEAAAPKR